MKASEKAAKERLAKARLQESDKTPVVTRTSRRGGGILSEYGEPETYKHGLLSRLTGGDPKKVR